MLAIRSPRLLVTAIAALSATACGFDCGTRSRTLASGTVRDAAGVTLGTAQADLSDNVGPSFKRLSVGVIGVSGASGAPLRGHVTRARLVSQSGELLAEIPTSTETLYSEGIVALNVDLGSQAEFTRVRSELMTARARVVLDTDLPGRDHLETTLTDATDVPGSIQRCRPN